MYDNEKAKALLTRGMVIQKENILTEGIIKSINVTYNNIMNSNVFCPSSQCLEMELSLMINSYIPNKLNHPFRKIALVYLDE